MQASVSLLACVQTFLWGGEGWGAYNILTCDGWSRMAGYFWLETWLLYPLGSSVGFVCLGERDR